MNTEDSVNKKYKIGLFMATSLVHGGGCENSFIKIAHQMSERDYGVTIVTLDRRAYRKIAFWSSFPQMVKITPIERENPASIKQRIGKAEWKELTWSQTKKALEQFDVIYTKNEFLDLLILKLMKSNKVPVICAVRSSILFIQTTTFYTRLHNLLYNSFLYRSLVKSVSSGIHLINRFDLDFCKDFFKKSELNFFYVPNTVNMKRFSPIDRESPRDNFKILFTGRLVEQKGIDFLNQIIDQLSLNKDFSHFSFTIVGSGALSPVIKKIIKKYPNIRWLPSVEKEKMPWIYREHDILINTSKWETFNLVILEAQACGLPVVSFDIPGPQDIIKDEATGYLIKLGDIKVFTKRVLDLYYLWQNDFLGFQKIQFNSKRRANENFSEEKVYSQLEQMFNFYLKS